MTMSKSLVATSKYNTSKNSISRRTCTWMAMVLIAFGAAVPVSAADDAPEVPPVSTFAAVKPLMAQLDYHLEEINESLEDPARYTLSRKTKVAKEASVALVLLMALGMHDQDNPLQKAAPALVELAGKVVDSAEDYAQAKSAYEALVIGMKGGTSGGTELKWEPRAKLGLLMKQVTTLNSRLKRYTRERYYERYIDQTPGQAAALAVIAQAALVDTHEVKDLGTNEQWYGFAAAMRDAAAKVGEGLAKKDVAATAAAVEELQKTCTECHKVFRPDQL